MCYKGRHLAGTRSSELDRTEHGKHVARCQWLHENKLHSETKG